jgi:4-amino-4-deoxy-L-arabinose transferase-like glycosyltransferase
VPFRRIALILAVAAGVHGLVYVPLVSTSEKTDSWSYVAAANALRDGSYSTPLKAGFVYVFPEWFDITGARIPEAVWFAPERQVFRPPGYPLYLAPFGKEPIVGGDHTAALVGQAVLFGLGAWLLMLTVRRWWGDGVALVAGLLYAIDPWSKHYVPLVLSETLAGTVLLAAVYVFTRAWENGRIASWGATGALAGIVALVRAVFVVAAPLVVVAALVRRGTTRERVLRALAAAASSAVLLVPWLSWTNHVVGRATMSVWGEGYNLILAASGEGHGTTAADVEAEAAFRARMESIRRSLPPAQELATDPTAHPRYLSRADERLRSDAWELYRDRLRDEPLDVLGDAVYRMWFLWAAHEDWSQPEALAVPFVVLDVLLLSFALAGSAIALMRGGAARPIVLFLLGYTIVLAMHHVEARFSIPLRGLYLALVALALAESARYLRSGRADQ